VVIWSGDVQIPEPRPIAEMTLEFTYEYDAGGILYVTLKDLERDSVIPPLDTMPITFGVTKDRKALVNLAGRVKAVESAANGQLDGAKQALDAELRKYSYLF
jgi:hypothetical protein